MRRRSVAEKNVIVLILSLLPFIIGLSFSVYKSAERESLSAAINIAGSQRMRTMLIANYAQQYNDSSLAGDMDRAKMQKQILIGELETYQIYFDTLAHGNTTYKIEANNYPDIDKALAGLQPVVEGYIQSAGTLLENPASQADLNYIVDNAMGLKNGFHNVTELYQMHNDAGILKQRRLDIIMIIFGITVTVVGLFLTAKIKSQEFHANYDFLTKLPNRYSLFDFIKDKQAEQYSIFFIDLNKFKVINDTYGHEIGDDILIGISQKLGAVFGTERLFRYGGDEFIALVENRRSRRLDAEECDAAIDRYINEIRQRLSEPITDTYGRKHFAGLAMGVVSSNVRINSWSTLINLADDLMYESKGSSENAIVFRTKEDYAHRVKFLKSVDDIFANSQFMLNYQPVYNLEDGSVAIYNVSSRWEDQGKAFCAAEFLSILKRKGHLVELDKITLKTMDADYMNRKAGDMTALQPLRYAVTLSEETLSTSHLNGIFALIEEMKMPRDKIILKIQDEFLDNTKLNGVLHQFKEMGFQLALDNFTVNLSFKEFERYADIAILKIGNALVQTMIDRQHRMNVLKELVMMLLCTDKTVIIEGISGENLKEALKEISQDIRQDKVLHMDAVN